MKKYNLKSKKKRRNDDDELFLASAVLTATPISLEKERSPNYFFCQSWWLQDYCSYDDDEFKKSLCMIHDTFDLFNLYQEVGAS